MSAPILDETHDPAARSFVVSADHHPDFAIQNLPLGAFRRADEGASRLRGGVRIGDDVLDFDALATSGCLHGAALDAARAASDTTVKAYFALGPVPRPAPHELLSTDSDGGPLMDHLLDPVDDVVLALQGRDATTTAGCSARNERRCGDRSGV